MKTLKMQPYLKHFTGSRDVPLPPSNQNVFFLFLFFWFINKRSITPFFFKKKVKILIIDLGFNSHSAKY